MLILIKCIIAIGSFIFRFFLKDEISELQQKILVDGVDLHFRTIETKRESFLEYSLHFRCSNIFSISAETKWDRFLKALGFCEEVQTGDVVFDHKFFIASDSLYFQTKITRSSLFRKLISALFAHGCLSILCDGKILKFKFSNNISKITGVQAACVRFSKELIEFKKEWRSDFTDPHFLKLLAVEATLWCFAAYSILGILDLFFLDHTTHLNPWDLLIKGLLLGFIVSVILLAIFFILLKGNPRGNRILWESLVALLFSFPITGTFFAHDLNIKFDTSKPYLIKARVIDSYTKFDTASSSRRGLRNRIYDDTVGKLIHSRHILKVSILDGPKGMAFPDEIKVPFIKQMLIDDDDIIEITVGKGYLNLPWIKNISLLERN